MRHNARQYAIERFDLRTVTLPAHLALIHRLSGINPVPRANRRRSRAARLALVTAQ